MSAEEKFIDYASANLARKKVLVVGDWAVDNNLITMIHRVPTSTRFGLEHDLILNPIDKSSAILGGAGRAAYLLHHARCDVNPLFEVRGIGLWHCEDTGEILAMLNDFFNEGLSLHRLSRQNHSLTDEKVLFNLGNILPKKDSFGTTIITRRYRREGKELRLLGRSDGDLLPLSNQLGNQLSDQPKWITDERMLEKSALEEFLDRECNDIDAIVIKDIVKGVISTPLIKLLVKKFRDKSWFISSKDWRPGWFEFLKDVDIRVLLITQVAAQRALQKESVNRWVTKSGYPTKEALEEMDDVARFFNKSERLIIVTLPEEHAMLGRDGRPNEIEGWIQSEVKTLNIDIETSMASVLFPVMISYLLNDENISLEYLLKRSLRFTQDWMSFEVQMLDDLGKGSSELQLLDDLGKRPSNSVPIINLNSISDSTEGTQWGSFKWEEAKTKWDQALSHCGVVTYEGQKYIELWRSMIEVDDYVCCVKSNRETLRIFVEELTQFKQSKKREHNGYLLVASPGSGKTFLMERLAKSIGLHFQPFNVTQMVSKYDIIDWFDTIVSEQSKQRDIPFLIFVDEINAKLSGQYIFDTFLEPLASGKYTRAGKTFYIEPCAWIFVGTKVPIIVGESDDQTDKVSDFISRLKSATLYFNFGDGLEKELQKTENVYRGVFLLKQRFKEVTSVSDKVLNIFHMIPPDLPVRKLWSFVKEFDGIQLGRVLSKNVPTKLFSEFNLDLDTWNSITNEGEMIEIEL
jgi:hypothetical protein